MANDNVDDDDDDFDFNEDISNEDVEKLVQSITANELDSGEVIYQYFIILVTYHLYTITFINAWLSVQGIYV